MGTGFFAEAEPLLTEAYEDACESGYKDIAARALNFLGTIKIYRGNLHRASELLQQGIELAGLTPASFAPRLSLSNVLYEWNDLEASAQQQQRVIEISRSEPNSVGPAQGYFFLAHTKLAQGDVAGATSAIEKSDELNSNPGVARANRARHAAYRFMFANRQADAQGLLHWGNQVLEYADDMPPFLWHLPPRALISRGDKAEAAVLIKAVYERAVRAGALGLFSRIRICQTLAAATPAEALTFLGEALVIGQPEGFIRTFVDEGKLLAPLLRKALAQGVTPEYTARLIDIIEIEERRRQATPGKGTMVSASPKLVSERELEVLRLVAEGLSNQQIAAKLSISLSTAKTHVYHLFEKISAKDRLQAVTRARELKLI